MDLNSVSYDELKRFYSKYFSLGNINVDINTKFALISFICYLTLKIRDKKPNITCYQVIRKIVGDSFPDNYVIGLTIICEDFSYGCTEFPTFGLKDKEIPGKIKEILLNWLPF